MTSLTEFAAAEEPARKKAWLETIPEYEEVVEGYRQGLSGATIRRWLVTIYGEDAVPNRSSITDFLRERHPRAAS